VVALGVTLNVESGALKVVPLVQLLADLKLGVMPLVETIAYLEAIILQTYQTLGAMIIIALNPSPSSIWAMTITFTEPLRLTLVMPHIGAITRT